MCGIVGIVSKSPVSTAMLARMTRSLAHRGPDGEGMLLLGRCDAATASVPTAHLVHEPILGGANIGFGHRRLAIVDTSEHGHQPMTYRGRYLITFNGEIYNFVELRRELQQSGYEFRTATDTEVIMAAFDRWGMECQRRFNGMWAFALYDKADNKLFLSRDRLGVKPLYLMQSSGSLKFASEVKALLHSGSPLAPNDEKVRSFLGDNPNDYRPETMFAGVTTLAPGGYMYGTPDEFTKGHVAVNKFWELTVNTSDEPFDDTNLKHYRERYFELLSDAVRLRLRADVPVGSALSGGLDSTSIVHIVNQQLAAVNSNSLQRVFSSTYPAPEHSSIDESATIRRMVASYNLDAREITPTADMVQAEYARMIYAMDEPPVGTCMSGWMTFKLVANSGIKVTLDGQGADEQLAGYLYYFTYWLCQSRSVMADAREAMKLQRARRFTAAGVAFNVARRLRLQGPARAALRAAGKLHDPFKPLNVRLREDTLGILGRLLHYADRISMAHGVESRMPFLDFRLVEFLAATPAAFKLRNGWTKYLARSAMNGLLPDHIVWKRDKLGWPSPDAQWLRGPLRQWALAEVGRSKFLKELGLAKDLSLLVDEDTRAFNQLLNIATWHRVFFEGELPGLKHASGDNESAVGLRKRHISSAVAR